MRERQRERHTERDRERESEREREREGGRETERQRDRETEREREYYPYLSPDLVSALAGLEMDDFSHVSGC